MLSSFFDIEDAHNLEFNQAPVSMMGKVKPKRERRTKSRSHCATAASPRPSPSKCSEWKGTYPHCENTIVVEAFLNLAIHPFQMPPDEVPADTDRQPLSLCDATRRETCKVSEIPRVEQRVRVVLGHKQTREDVVGLGGLVGESANGLDRHSASKEYFGQGNSYLGNPLASE